MKASIFHSLLSNNREKALRTAQLAIDYLKQHEVHIVGVDLSGNPTVKKINRMIYYIGCSIPIFPSCI